MTQSDAHPDAHLDSSIGSNNPPRPDRASLPGMPASRVSNRRTLVIGHRGASALAPENTLAAFRAAAALPTDGVEFDVQRTADGHLIVFHDDTIERTTNGTGVTGQYTLAELQALDAGSWFDPAFAGEQIPTLADTLDLLAQTELLLFIELKSPALYPGIEGEIIAMIRQFGLADRVQLRSFEHDSLHRCYAIDPEIPISELWPHKLPDDDEMFFPTLNAYYPLATPDQIAYVHARGQKITVWTVDDLDMAQQLKDAGIDGITSNAPDRILTLFDD